MYGAITLYRATFQKLPLTNHKLKGWSPFARRYWGNIGWFLFLRVLRYFSSPGLLLHPMYSGADIVQVRWVSPFGNLRIKVCLPTPRSLSQATTSFIAFSCQGIHQMHFYAWPYNPTYWSCQDCMFTRVWTLSSHPFAFCATTPLLYQYEEWLAFLYVHSSPLSLSLREETHTRLTRSQ